MTPEEKYIMSHYQDIAEAKQRDVRRMQAEIFRGALRGVITAAIIRLQRAPDHGEAQSSQKT